jgi:hypothetical protein
MMRERQEMVTELRSLGDKRTIVVHTNDNQVYRKLHDSGKPVKVILYEQEQGGKVAIVGVDLYFPEECQKWLQKNVGVRLPESSDKLTNVDIK